LEERQAKQQEEKLYAKAKLQAEERHKQAEERERQQRWEQEKLDK